VRARTSVVATGPWTGSRLLGDAGQGLVTLSKGIHIVMRSEHIAVRQPVVVQAQAQRRILFVVPWGSRTYLGTTDSPYTGDPGASGVTVEDEAELLGLVGRIFTHAALQPDHVVSAWSGVRPLVRSPHAPQDTAELARTHRIVENSIGVLGIVGGKLTTYRAMAEQVVDRACARIQGRGPGPLARGRTVKTPLVPGVPIGGSELDDPVLADLAPRHGPLARVLAERARDDPTLAPRMIEDLPYRWVEVEHAIAHEACTHLDDVLRRRLPIALTDPRLGAGVARRVAERLVDARGGREADVRAELERYRDAIARETRRAPAV
jgi:glycerol-3-phosphate dehydrogenase